MIKRMFGQESNHQKIIEALEKNKKASETLLATFATTRNMTMDEFLQELNKQQKNLASNVQTTV